MVQTCKRIKEGCKHLVSVEASDDNCDDIISFRSSTISNIKVYFKTLFSNQFSGSKDYYQWILFFDVLCFITIVLGYSHFYVSEEFI